MRASWLPFFWIGFFGVAGCVKKSDSSALDSQQSASSPVMTGLHALPDSPARVKSQKLFRDGFLRKLTELVAATPVDAATKTAQAMTLRAFKFSIDNITSGQSCVESEKITLYRGHGKQGWRKQSDKRFQAAAANGFDGYKKSFDKLDYDGIFWATRFLVAPSGADLEIPLQMRLDNLMRSHTMDSENSSLISATLTVGAAETFGPQVMELRMCPERVFPVYDIRYYSEYEFYIPLFILPEEMVSDGLASRFSKKVPEDGHADALWHCFTNLGTALEESYAREEETTVRESEDENRPEIGILKRYRGFRDEVYGVLETAETANVWRDKMLVRAAQCKIPDCKVAKRVELTEQHRLIERGEQATAADKAQLESFRALNVKACGSR